MAEEHREELMEKIEAIAAKIKKSIAKRRVLYAEVCKRLIGYLCLFIHMYFKRKLRRSLQL